jgi:serine/threonine protein phosphatase 1
MSKTFIVGDIHGGLRALKQLFEKINPTENDKFIFLGDYVDGWSESAQVISYLIEFEKKQECIFIKGNHDDYCAKWMKTKIDFAPWIIQSGGQSTVDSYKNYTEEQKMVHLNFIEHMKLYYIDEKNNLFIHAGFTSLHGVEYDRYEPAFYWDRTLWEMAAAMDTSIPYNSPRYPARLKKYNEIFIGHTTTLSYGETQPMHIANVWNLDTGAGYNGRLTAIELRTKEIIQSDKLVDLYPNEKGRN